MKEVPMYQSLGEDAWNAFWQGPVWEQTIDTIMPCLIAIAAIAALAIAGLLIKPRVDGALSGLLTLGANDGYDTDAERK